MTQLLPNGKQQFLDINGKPLVGGKVAHYVVSTNTPKATYQDYAQTIPNTNPVVLDARGQAAIYGTGLYRQVVNDATGVLIWDQIIPDASGVFITDLSNTIDPTKGVSLIPTAGRIVATISTLRTLPKTGGSTAVFVQGYYDKGDGGGGNYYLDVADTTSPDNGGSIIVATDGGRWKLDQPQAENISQFGAVASISDAGPRINAALSQGGLFNARDALYKIVTPVTVSYAGTDFPEIAVPSKRVDFLGDSMGNTIFEHAPVAGIDQCFKFEGTVVGAVGQGVHGQDRVGNFSVYCKGRPYPSGQKGIGLYVLNKSYTSIENISTEYMNYGMEFDGVLSSEMRNCYLKNGVIGLMVNKTAISLPNALTFVKNVFSGNSQAGVIFNSMGAGNVFIGGSIEGNGTQGDAAKGGMAVNLDGSNGTACLTMNGTYFEANGGGFDLKLDNVTAFNVTVVLNGCLFNRTSSGKYATNNILVTSSGGGKVKLVLNGCSFLSAGTYVPSNTRPFIDFGANCEVIGWDTCTYSETTSIKPAFNSSSSAVLSGSVQANGTIDTAPVGVAVVRNSAGQYTVTKTDGWAPTVDGFHVMANINNLTGSLKIDYCVKVDQSTFRIGFRLDSVSAYTDTAFSFSVARTK